MGELNVLFPGKSVPLPDGSVVNVTPLSLKDLPKVVEAFGTIMKLATEQARSEKKVTKTPTKKKTASDKLDKSAESAYAEIAAAGMKELLQILPYCIDRQPEEIPFEAVPEIITIVIEQNVTDSAIKKWTALVQTLAGLLPKSVGQSVKSKL